MIVLAVLLSILTGFLLVRAIWPAPSFAWDNRGDWFRLGAGAMLGIGLASIPAFFTAQAQPADLALFAAAAVLFALFGRPRTLTIDDEYPAPKILTWTLLALLVVFAPAYVTMAQPNPYGELDTWRIWNFRARFLYRGGTLAELANPALQYTHPELPYLVTSSVLRTWRWGGEESPLGAMLLAGTYGFSLIAILYGAIRAMRGQAQSLLMLAAILASTAVTGNAATQFADIPFAALVAAAFASLLMAWNLSEPRLYLLTGLAAGLLPWTKNEGWFYAVPLLAVALWKGKLSGALFTVLGAIPGAATAAYFLLNVAPAIPGTAATFPALSGAIVSRLLTLNLFGWVITPVVILAIYTYFVGFRRNRQLASGITAALLLIGGIASILYRDDNPGDSAAFRILLHVWPAILLVLFVEYKTPEECVLGGIPKPTGKSRK
ncbi:hypothetical protein F183_A46150 [Bryobacterales bacterium F-183]|nr:hypothetical protein F183_A46150 [Bryobacterales bacterium F-183]